MQFTDKQLAALLKGEFFVTKKFIAAGEQKIHKVAEGDSSFDENEKKELLREVENVRNKLKKFLALPGDLALKSIFSEEKLHAHAVIVGKDKSLRALYARLYEKKEPYLRSDLEKKALALRINQVLQATKL